MSGEHLTNIRSYRMTNAARVGLYVFLCTSALFFLLPIILVLLNSFKSMEEIRSASIFRLPQNASLDSFRIAWSSACSGLSCRGISPGLWNSVIITVPAVVLSTLAGALNGFALAQWKSPKAGLVLLAVTVGLFIPYQVMIYPTVKMLSFVGLFGSYLGLIIVHVIYGLPYTTLLFRNFYIGVSSDLANAARIEGAGLLRIFRSIILPLSANMLVVVGILQFTGIWNDYLLGFILAGNDYAPMTVQLNNLVNNTRGEVALNVNMAATLLTAAPTLLVYFISGRFFVRGIASGAVKG